MNITFFLEILLMVLLHKVAGASGAFVCFVPLRLKPELGLFGPRRTLRAVVDWASTLFCRPSLGESSRSPALFRRSRIFLSESGPEEAACGSSGTRREARDRSG